MNIREITSAQWNDYCKGFESTSFCQSVAYGRFVESLGYTAIFLALSDQQGTVLSLCMCYIIPAKRGKFIAIAHGPIFTHSSTASRKQFALWESEWCQQAKKHNCSFIRFAPADRSVVQFLHKKWKYSLQALHAEQTTIVDLTQDEQDILKNMRKTTRHMIRNALRLVATGDLRVEYKTSLEKEMFDLYSLTTQRGKFSGYSHNYLQKEVEIFLTSHECILITVYYRGTLVSWGLILQVNGRAYYHQGANTFIQHVPAAALLHWEAMKHSKYNGCTSYDLWGVSPQGVKNHKWKNITLFKNGFGGVYTERGKTMDLPVKPLYWLTRAYEYLQQLMKR